MTKRQRGDGTPTIHDVAAAAGVSRATAARALGGYGPVSDEARARVMTAADRLGYRPNRLARSMITGTTHTLGVVIADIQLAFFAQAVRGISDAAHAEDFEVILANTDEDCAAERAAVDVLVDKRVDGLIVAPADTRESDHLLAAQRRGIPVVLIDRGCPDLGCDVVLVDNQRAARNAANHLIRLGHRRIAIVTEAASALPADEITTARLQPAGQMTSVLRQAGWAAALRGAGLPVTDDLIRRARYDRDDARAATAAALAGPDRPTAPGAGGEPRPGNERGKGGRGAAPVAGGARRPWRAGRGARGGRGAGLRRPGGLRFRRSCVRRHVDAAARVRPPSGRPARAWRQHRNARPGAIPLPTFRPVQLRQERRRQGTGGEAKGGAAARATGAKAGTPRWRAII